MKKSWKYGLIGAAAALAAVLLPYEIDRNDDGEFSYNSLLLGVYRRKRSDGEHATSRRRANLPGGCFCRRGRIFYASGSNFSKIGISPSASAVSRSCFERMVHATP